jgi:tryptophan synthase alpha chain
MFNFIPFTVIGDPNYEASLEIVRAYVENGATMLELGVPFTDPVADGPVVQLADHRALAAGMQTDRALEFVRDVRKFTNIPIGLLVYYNSVFKLGAQNFYSKAAEVGVTSVLIADLPLEVPRCAEALALAKQYELDQIFIVSELTSPERLSRILEVATGFLYFVSTPGVTGVRTQLSTELPSAIARIKAQTDLPVLVGFGVSEREHVELIQKAGADGAIVGSRLVRLIEEDRVDEIPTVMAELLG